MPSKYTNTTENFGRRARLLHALLALLIMLLLALGLSFDSLPKGPIKMWAVSLHKLFGFCAAGLMIVWWAEFITRVKPLPPQGSSLGLHRLAVAVKWLLMVCATLMAFSGWLMSAASNRLNIKALNINLPNPLASPDKALAGFLWDIHETVPTLLLIAIGLHMAGALYHHFIRRDRVLVRMFPFIKTPK